MQDIAKCQQKGHIRVCTAGQKSRLSISSQFPSASSVKVFFQHYDCSALKRFMLLRRGNPSLKLQPVSVFCFAYNGRGIAHLQRIDYFMFPLSNSHPQVENVLDATHISTWRRLVAYSGINKLHLISGYGLQELWSSYYVNKVVFCDTPRHRWFL